MRAYPQVYYGKPADLPAYCQGLGKPAPAYSNIGEFFLELVDEYEAADNVKVLRMALSYSILIGSTGRSRALHS